MPHLKRWAQRQPQRAAIRMVGDGHLLTYAELDARADAVARWLLSCGLATGATVALLLENHVRTFELWFGARRAGLYYTPISIHLTAREVAYILRDCEARVVVASAATATLAREALDLLAADGIDAPAIVNADGTQPGMAGLEQATAPFAGDAPLPPRPLGRELFYSSGTTGFPKGIRRPLTPYEARESLPAFETTLRGMFGFDADTVYLAPAPLYHATGRFVIRILESGGRSVVMQKFDAATALEAIDRERVTHSQWVPTMFIRMLALPDAVRKRFGGRSMRVAIHAAAPCPPHVKQAMIDWWGPVIVEYYGGSENVGLTHITCAEWLERPGSVGRAVVGEIHIVGDDGTELPPGEVGTIYFANGPTFEYLNDPEKTRAAFDARGWGTYGDMGSVDAAGYLSLSDRRADLILSGGVNIYPQEIENVLTTHAAVADAAVVGVPNAEFGEEVKAVIELREGLSASPQLREELLAWCAARLGRLKCPRSIEFEPALPRSATGKLLRRVVKERYRGAR